MALTRINERTLVQKIKRLVLGDEKPKLFTRVSVIIGFFVWLYFTVWQILIFLSIIFVDRLQNPKMITDTFNRIGIKYAFMHRWGLDTINTLLLHSTVLIVIYFFNLLGLILIYKKNRTGFVLYLLANILSIGFSILFLGINYFNEQISIMDKLIFATISIYFLIVFILFKKK